MGEHDVELHVKTVTDLTDYIFRHPHIKYIRVHMGLRFWGGGIVRRLEDEDDILSENRNELTEVLSDNISIESLIFSGPSFASLIDLHAILRGIKGHPTFKTLIIPIIAPEIYTEESKVSYYIKEIIHNILYSKSMETCSITNGTNSERDMRIYNSIFTDTDQTMRLQRVINTMIIGAKVHRRRSAKL